MKSTHHRKNLIDLTLQQLRVRISSVLESIKSLSTIEDTSEIQIAALTPLYIYLSIYIYINLNNGLPFIHGPEKFSW